MLERMNSHTLRSLRRVLGPGALLLVAACSPALNWRDVQPDDTALSLLLPCKPDVAQQTVPMGGVPTLLTVRGCDAGGATFAVAVADVGNASALVGALEQWQSVTLISIKAGATNVERLAARVPGAAAVPAPVLVKALGQRPDGSAIHSHALYFAQGTQVFQVLMLASAVPPDAPEMFFSSVKLR
jgi:Mn2+/Fe2+ NRAMP family transporter